MKKVKSMDNKKSMVPLVLLVAAVFVPGLLYFLLRPRGSGEGSSAISQNVQEEAKVEPKTEEFVAKRAREYWEASKFKDYRGGYRLLDNKLRGSISEDEYIKRQEWLDENTLTGVVETTEIKIGEVRLMESEAEVRTTLVANTGEFSDITKLVYEDGVWHKVFEAYTALSIGKSWDEFVEENK